MPTIPNFRCSSCKSEFSLVEAGPGQVCPTCGAKQVFINHRAVTETPPKPIPVGRVIVPLNMPDAEGTSHEETNGIACIMYSPSMKVHGSFTRRAASDFAHAILRALGEEV